MKRLVSKLGALLCAGLFVIPAAGQQQAPATPVPVDANAAGETGPAIEAEAMAVLRRMTERLARAERFSVTIRAGYDVVQESGQKVEFGERRTVLLSRPDRLRVEAQLSDGDRRLVVFDGKTITVFDSGENVYAQLERPGSVDEAVRHVVRDLQVRLPLAMMFVTTLPAELEGRLQSLDYVEEDTLGEVPADHLAGRSEDVDFQIWIPQQGEPLPRRLVITYKNAEGAPQFWAVFSDWDLSPQASEAKFAFAPPEGAERIPFVVRVPKTGKVAEDKGAQR
jgi:hypothetical protein